MNTQEIEKLVLKHCKTFSGVFAANEINKIPSPSFAIVNTDELGSSGKHWVAVYLNDNLCEFFDSMGQSPLDYHSTWYNFLLNKSKSFIHNEEKIQPTGSSTCGEFCIFYTIMRSNGISFQKIIEILKTLDVQYYISQLVLTDFE